ncbi:MT-A70 family methyltransferase [Bradyrhizobium sp.]|uniref:MT-A70 family methyltransferase n=1 Tax=Bradyrhizobium sp. TaxID=376 RepID=UPI0025C10E96|nr:MT-A70 family methyltransferase [Bradyrhizobium sp.]
MLPFHPYADLFPLIEGAEFAELAADLKANDLRERIVVLDGAILDGRNRYRAALAAGLLEDDDGPDRTKYFIRFVPSVDGDPLGFVISKNLRRRHLNESQRAMVADRLATMRQGERTDLEPSANLPKVAQPDAARMLSVSERLVRHAKVVHDRGAPELQRAVDQGRLAVSAAAQAAKLTTEMQRRIAAEADAGRTNVVRSVIKQEARASREAALGEKQLALPDKKYGVILADPEWQFEPYSRDTGMDRAADNHYPTSKTIDICARPVATIAAADCVLFLWATAPMTPAALEVISHWGFAYKTHVIWHKTRNGHGRGSGFWFTGEHELLMVGTRGNVPAPATALCGSVIAAPWQGRHSAKPEAFAQLIERAFPTLPKIELNRRGPARPGWDAWGNEAEPAQSDTPAVPFSLTPLVGACCRRDGDWRVPLVTADDLTIPEFLRRRVTA